MVDRLLVDREWTVVQFNVSLNIVGGANVGNDLRVVKSTAFGGDGSVNIVNGDFTSFDTNTPYDDVSYTWLTGVNNITLNSTSATDIQNNNAFIVCLMQAKNDFTNTGEVSDLNEAFGIAFNLDITLTFDAAPIIPNNSLTISSGKLTLSSGKFLIVIFLPEAAIANLASINGVLKANIDSINGIS